MKKRLTGATFDASAQTIVHADFSAVGLAGIQLITNVTDNIVIYNFADSAKGGSLSTDTLTLDFDTTAMDDADELMILVEDGKDGTGLIFGNGFFGDARVTTSDPLPVSVINTPTISPVTASDFDIRDLNQNSDNVKAMPPSYIDAGNSSTSTLTANSTFTGTSKTVKEDGIFEFGTVLVTVFSNVSSATNGLEIQQSSDDTNWRTVAAYTYTTGSVGTFTASIFMKYCRIVYTNGGTNQLGFELSTTFYGGVLSASSGVVGGGTEAKAQRVTIANDSTGVLSVDDNGSTLSVDDGGGVLTVDGTVAVTGVSTSAKQDTVIGHLDGVETLLGTIDADTGNISTKIDTVAGAVSGSEMQVDVVSAPTLTVDSHDVTNAGTFAVQADTELPSAAALSDADSSTPTVPTVGAVTMIANAAASSVQRMRGVSATHNQGATGVPASGTLMQFDDASITSITENNFGVPRMSANRNAYTTIRDAAGNERGVNVTASNALVVDGSAVTQPVSNAALVTGSTTMNATSSDGGTALTNSAQVIKASAGRLMGYYIYNPNVIAAYVQFYNTAAASVTVGTTNPMFMLAIPPQQAANLWAGEDGPNFSNAGWSWAATATAGGNGAPTTALDAVAWHK